MLCGYRMSLIVNVCLVISQNQAQNMPAETRCFIHFFYLVFLHHKHLHSTCYELKTTLSDVATVIRFNQYMERV